MAFTTHFELHSQTTRLFESAPVEPWQSMSKTGFSPSVTLHSRRLVHSPVQVSTSLDYNSDGQRPPDYKFELFPVHSQLLRESWLVSFPSLILPGAVQHRSPGEHT